VGSSAQPVETHAMQAALPPSERGSHFHPASQVFAMQVASTPGASSHRWWSAHAPDITNATQVTGARHFCVARSQVSPPPHMLPAPHAQPATSGEQVWHTFMPSQYVAPSHFGSLDLHGHETVPWAHIVGVQAPCVQVRPAAQTSPAPHAQPCDWAGHVSHVWSAAQRNPALQVPFERHAQARSPRRQSVHCPFTHSPV
jgi:hypothetical protein